MKTFDGHVETTDLLPEYLRGELAGDRRRVVEDHLGGCPLCQAQARALKRFLTLQDPDPGEGFWDSLSETVRKRAEGERWVGGAGASVPKALRWNPIRTPFRTAAGLAAAALVLLAAFHLFRQPETAVVNPWALSMGPVISLGIETEILSLGQDKALVVERMLELNVDGGDGDLEMLLPGSGRAGLEALLLDEAERKDLEKVLDRMGEQG